MRRYVVIEGLHILDGRGVVGTIGTDDGRFWVALELEKNNAWRNDSTDKILTNSRRDKEANTTNGGARRILGC